MSTNTAVLSISLFLSASTFAADTAYQTLLKQGLHVDGSVPHKIILNNNQTKIIRLMNISLSPMVAKKLSARASDIIQNPYRGDLMNADDMPSAIRVGMNGESVLDQGQWGTCATFSSSGAINAMLSLSGDSEASQLCNLAVGKTLQNGTNGGWNGSFGYLVLGQISQYGFVNKQYQHAHGCGGLKKYPADSDNSGSAMPLAKFTANAAIAFTANDWTPILSYDGTFAPVDSATAAKALNDVKKALNKGNRVVFGSLIDGSVGEVGATGSYNGISNDTWVMTSGIQQDFQNDNPMEGHEIIIDGYDDNACATYTDNSKSVKQCGLLRVRNSWGASAGDQGDYYMSYDHFKGMVIEAYAIGHDVKNKFQSSVN